MVLAEPGGPELLIKPADVWLKAPVKGIHMATTSAAAGAVSEWPLSSAVEFEMGACLSLEMSEDCSNVDCGVCHSQV